MKNQQWLALICSFTALMAWALLVAGYPSQAEVNAPQGPDLLTTDSVFAEPAKQQICDRLQVEAAHAFRTSDYATARRICEQLLRFRPKRPEFHYNLACSLSRTGETDLASTSLRKAIELGFRDTEKLQLDDDLAAIRQSEQWPDILSAAATPAPTAPLPVNQSGFVPARINHGVAMIDNQCCVWNPSARQIDVHVGSPEVQLQQQDIAVGSDDAAKLLRRWQQEGTAAGHVGVLYDNHDKDHSNLEWKNYPQLTRIEYSADAKRFGIHNGLQCTLRFNQIVLGNSSTAIVGGPFWRSQSRLAYSNPFSAAILANQYFNNHLYIYPEHNDFDPGRNGGGGYGDTFTANTPYLITSLGSSYSDKVFLDAFAATLAAFNSECREALVKSSSLMPCLQMVFRRSNRGINSDKDYLTGIAHPAVFQGSNINKVAMMEMAHAMQAKSIPPVAVLDIIKEESFEMGRDYFDVRNSEILCTTPSAVARVGRAVQQTRNYQVSARKCFDPNGRPLTYHWAVLQGSSDLVDIKHLLPDASQVTISVKHHRRQPIQSGADIESSRVDIALFAHNGLHYSAPAILSLYWPENEERTYDADGRILIVKYSSVANGGNYTDPALVSERNWTDTYDYTPEGALIGWHRTRGESQDIFTRHGYIVTETDAQGRASQAVTVEYMTNPSANGTPVLSYSKGTESIRYEYRGEKDLLGRPMLVNKSVE